jgi:hypothetical protein
VLETAQSVADYVIATGTAHITPKSSFGEREQAARELLPILMATENDLQQHYNIQRLALRLHLDERTLIQWTQHYQRRARLTPPIRQPTQPSPPSSQSTQPAQTLQPSSTAVPDAQTIETARPGSAAERYCLAILIRRSDLLYIANRRLRELSAQTPGTREALGPLTAEDFVHSDFRGIFNVLERALAQDDLEPVEYLEQHLPYELATEVKKLLVEPLDAFRQQLVPSMHAQLAAELEVARKKKEWMTAGSSSAELEFVHRVLDLRKQRLKRDNQDLYFLIQDADPDSEQEYNRRVMVNRLAIRFIDEAVNQVAQLQREH